MSHPDNILAVLETCKTIYIIQVLSTLDEKTWEDYEIHLGASATKVNSRALKVRKTHLRGVLGVRVIENSKKVLWEDCRQHPGCL